MSKVTWHIPISIFEEGLNEVKNSFEACNLLGLNGHRENRQYVLLAVQENGGIRRPTIFDAGFYPGFYPYKHNENGWGITLESTTLEKSLPEAVTKSNKQNVSIKKVLKTSPDKLNKPNEPYLIKFLDKELDLFRVEDKQAHNELLVHWNKE